MQKLKGSEYSTNQLYITSLIFKKLDYVQGGSVNYIFSDKVVPGGKSLGSSVLKK